MMDGHTSLPSWHYLALAFRNRWPRGPPYPNTNTPFAADISYKTSASDLAMIQHETLGVAVEANGTHHMPNSRAPTVASGDSKNASTAVLPDNPHIGAQSGLSSNCT